MEEENELSYDSVFEFEKNAQNPPKGKTGKPLARNQRGMGEFAEQMASTYRGENTGFGKSKYDKLANWDADIDDSDIKGSLNEFRADKQGFTETALTGVGRAAVKGMAEAAKTPGVIVGTMQAIGGQAMDILMDKDDTNFVKTAFNNQWIKGIDSINKEIQDDLMPVYVHKAVQDGDLFDKMFSSEFWATDGADGVGYAAGMILPGAALGKLGLGAKLIGASNRLEKAAEIFAAANRAEEFVNKAQKLGAIARNIDSGIAVTYNTVAEAGAEAKEFGDRQREPENKANMINGWKAKGYLNTPEYQQEATKYLQSLDEKRRAGEITLDEQNALTSDPKAVENAVLEKRFEDEVSRGELGVFGMNAMILLGPNALMHQRLFGRIGRSAEKIAEKGAATAATAAVEGAEVASKKGLKKMLTSSTAKYIGEKAAKYGKIAGENLAAEGFWEEGMQSTVSNMFETYAKDNKLDYAFDFNPIDVVKEYADMIGSTEGQVAVMLGGVLGTGMSGISTHFQTKQENKIKNAILNKVDVSLNTFNTIFNSHDIYERDEDGKIVFEKDKDGNNLNKPKIDKEKASNVVKSLAVNDFEQILYQHAIDQGNHDFIRDKQEEALYQMVLPAIYNGEKGIQLLKQQMDANKDFQDIVARDSDPAAKFQFKDILDKAIKTAEHLQKENDKFNDFSDAMISLEDERLDRNPSAKKIRADYMNELNDRYLQSKFRIFNNESRLKDLEKQRNDVMQELNIHMTPEELLSNTRLVNNTILTNPLFKKTIEDIRLVSDQIRKDKKDIAEVWDGKATKQSFKEFVEAKLKNAEETENEDAVQDTIEDIGKTNSPEELDKVLNKDMDEDFPGKDKVFEYQKIKRIVESVNEDSSVENLDNALNALRNTKYNSYNTQRLIKTLENRINIVTKERASMRQTLEDVIDDYAKVSQQVADKYKELSNSIDDLILENMMRMEELEKFPKKIRGRNSKIIKEAIKGIKEEISKTEEKIDELVKQRDELVEKSAKIDSRLNPLLNALENVDKQDFRSIKDVIKYLKDNQEEFNVEEAEINRLTVEKFYTEKSIEHFNSMIDDLEGYKTVLEGAIRDLLASDEEKSEDLYFLQEELNDTVGELQDKKKELAAKEKRLKEIVNSNQFLERDLHTLLGDEIDLFEKLDEIKKSKPKTIFSNVLVDKIISEKKDQLNQAKDAENKESEAVGEELTAEQEFQLQFLEENYAVGEELDVRKEFGLPAKMTGKTATVTKITPGKSVTVKTEDGKTASIDIAKFYKATFNPELNFGTEGGAVETTEKGQRYDKDKPAFTTNGAKVVSVDEDGNPLEFIDPNFISFERNPNVTKIGQKVSFEVNTSAQQKGEWRMALAAFAAGDFTKLDDLIKHLPINMVIDIDGVKYKAPIETYYETKEGKSDQFDKTTKVLRTTIIKELEKGTKMEALSTVVEGQYNGQLQVEPEVVENRVQDLMEFGGDMSNVKAEDIYIVNDLGALVNHKNKIFPTNRELAPGEVYVQIRTAAGYKFPLKLNVKRINAQQADALYELYQYRFENIKDRTKARTMKEVRADNPELVAQIERDLAKEIEVIGKKVDDISIKDLIDFMIWDGTNSIKSRMKFMNTRGQVTKLAIFEKEYSQEQFAKLPKQTFINMVTSSSRGKLGKRQHIKFKPTKDSGIKGIHMGNTKYLNYLLSEGILNTNAVVGINNPTFQGPTNMYLDTRNLKVNDESSAFNPEQIIEVDNSNIMGDPVKFAESHPELYAEEIKLSDDHTHYKNQTTDEVYRRVSELKTMPGDTDNGINVASTVRGEVIDELMRIHLGSLITEDIFQFTERGKQYLASTNEKKGTDVRFSDKAFEDLYHILEDYKKYFAKEGIKILTSTPTLGGKIGKESFAGTIDIFGYDMKTGQYMIIDLKTSTVSRADQYADPKSDKWNYILKDAIQQNAYAELFEQMTGKPIRKLFIMPLIVPKESANSYNVNEVLKDSTELIPVSMDKDIYQLKHIQKEGKKIVPISEQNLKDLLLKDWQEAMKAGARPNMTMSLNGVQYGYIDSIAVMAYQDKNKDLIMVQDKDLIIKVLKEGNSKIAQKMAVARVDIDKFEKTWNSRANKLSLQKAKPVEAKPVTKPKIVPTSKPVSTPTVKQVNNKMKENDIPTEGLPPGNLNLLSEMNSLFGMEPISNMEATEIPTSTEGLGLERASERNMDFMNMMGVVAPSIELVTNESEEEVKETVQEMVEEQEGLDIKSMSNDQVGEALDILEGYQTQGNAKDIDDILNKKTTDRVKLQELHDYFMGKANAEEITKKLKGCN